MKHILLPLLLCIAFYTNAQDHLAFKGIPIEGSMTTFCQKLKAKGFTQMGKDKNITLFTGDFTGRQATIGVGASGDGKNVFSVVVLFDPSKEWNSLVSTYDYYKDLYTRKYGEPAISKENNPSHLDSNTSRMLALYEDKVEYKAEWNLPEGDIIMWIEKAPLVKGNVIIRYINSQYLESNIQKDLDDI